MLRTCDRMVVLRDGVKVGEIDDEMTQTDALDEFLIRIHNETFAVSGMIFQDAWNLDLDRLKRCYICEVDPDHGMVPFCAYNLTNLKGIYLYRK